jgi:hypothetical protein
VLTPPKDAGSRDLRWPGEGRAFLALLAAAMTAVAAEPARSGDIEVHPALIWVTTDDTGRHENRVEYAAQVVTSSVESDGIVIDMSQPVGLLLDTPGAEQPVFDGVVLRLTVFQSGDSVQVSGRAEYETLLGVTSSHEDIDSDLHARTVRRYTTYFRGHAKLGRELRIQAAEDINDGVSVALTFTTGP